MNFKTSIFIIFLAIFALSIQSCANRRASVQNVVNENSLLWRVSGNGLAQPSYLFGTHHLVPVSFLDDVYGWREAFERTEQTVGELVLSDMAEMQMQMMQHAMMPEGVTYESLLSAEDIALLDSKLTSLLGVGIKQLGMLNPAMLMHTITLTLYQQYFPETVGLSIDEYFQQKALARSRPIRALDTFESQIYGLFGVSSVERQAELLMCMVREMRIEQFHQLHELYYTFDINGLYELFIESNKISTCPMTDEEINALTRNRPLRCIDQLSAIINEKPSFIAVGALHLPGEYGLIEGLRRAGFTVEPVN
jgi:uncharacterized protein YbaP (TraB family)